MMKGRTLFTLSLEYMGSHGVLLLLGLLDGEVALDLLVEVHQVLHLLGAVLLRQVLAEHRHHPERTHNDVCTDTGFV